MKYVKATIDGRDIYLEQLPNGNWMRLNEAPSYPGIYPITIELMAENGVLLIIGDDDPALGEFLRLFVLGEPRSKLISYLPWFMQKVPEYRNLLRAAGIEVDRLHDNIQIIIDDAFILTASEARIMEWEKALCIVPIGTVAQRKSFIISYLRGQGKLNEAKIKQVVNAFTGGDSVVTFSNSAILIKILVPPMGDVYRFPDVERALRPKVPAHIGLQVQRFYSTWGDVKSNYSGWDDVENLTNWGTLKNYIP